MNSTITPHLHRQFKRSFQWTLLGSIIYETLKILHCFILKECMSESIFGAMGSVFSLIYLTTYIADFGATNSIPPFLSLCTKSRKTFAQFFINYSLVPHLPLVIIGAIAAMMVAATKFPLTPYLVIIPLLIIMETVRSFLRLLLHTTFQAKRAVSTELVIFFLYLAAIWLPYCTGMMPLSLNHIFAIHLIDSTATVGIFIWLTIKFYRSLPQTESSSLPSGLSKRLIATKLFNYMLRVSRNMFSSNFLTPLFATKYGLVAAGMFYFASMLANTIQAIVKSVIGYSGNALLANLKDSPQHTKKEAFSMLFGRFMYVVAPIIIIVILNLNNIIRLSSSHSQPGETIAILLLFLLISFTEFFFILYEQFYIIEEAAHKLFFTKVLELLFFYLLITSPLSISPITTLVGLIIIRVISFSIIACNAYYWWKIRPHFTIGPRYLIACIAAALALAMIGNYYLWIF